MVEVRRSRAWSGIAIASILVVLTGCAETSTGTPPAAAPALSRLLVAPGGIRGLQIGVPVPASTGLVTYGEHRCPKSGGWIAGYPQDTLNSSGQELDAFDIVTEDSSKSGIITNEFIWSKQLSTPKGIRVGSPLADVVTAYPNAARSTSYSTALYAVAGAKGTLIIEVASQNASAAGEWPATVLGTVVWMHVVRRGAKVSSIAGNNNAGPCPVRGKDPGDTDDD